MTLLGKNSPVPEAYAPEILFPIPRFGARDRLGIGAELPFYGEDVWHAWELAWLAPGAQPRNAVGRFTVPADSTHLVESKSFKLYLNSLNRTEFESEQRLRDTLERDLSAVAGAAVRAELLALDSDALALTPMPGDGVDAELPRCSADQPDAGLLEAEASPGTSQVLHSHALRSLCPVTAQPDWATVVVWLEGARLEPASLVTYLGAFHDHQEYHEQCVERMFRDLREVCGEAEIAVQALYTRRGGLDINPWRSSRPGTAPRLRACRQ